MTYVPQVWSNGEGGDTPLNDDALNHMEEGIEQASTMVRLPHVQYSMTIDVDDFVPDELNVFTFDTPVHSPDPNGEDLFTIVAETEGAGADGSRAVPDASGIFTYTALIQVYPVGQDTDVAVYGGATSREIGETRRLFEAGNIIAGAALGHMFTLTDTCTVLSTAGNGIRFFFMSNGDPFDGVTPGLAVIQGRLTITRLNPDDIV